MKNLLKLIVLAVLVSCAKQELPTPNEKNVKFVIGNIQSGDIKGAQDLLSSTKPTGPFTISLTSTTNSNRKYTITAGEETSIILDTYTATCRYTPSVQATGINAKLFLEPSFYVKTDVTIAEDTDVVTLQAEYTCIALIQEQSSTSKYTFSDEPSHQTDLLTQVEADGYAVTYIAYVGGWTPSYGLSVVAVPVDDVNYETTRYQLVSTTQSVSDGQLYVENGKWYILRPIAAETSSGTIGVSFPEWTEGTTE